MRLTLPEKLFYAVRAPGGGSERETTYAYARAPMRLRALLGSDCGLRSAVRVQLFSGGEAQWKPLSGENMLFLFVSPSENYEDASFAFRWRKCGKLVSKSHSVRHGTRARVREGKGKFAGVAVECRVASTFPLLLVSFRGP
tara:strand:- start:207 stop:629 length:423 start_codon:yes stop_codon:yes gene_type:complete